MGCCCRKQNGKVTTLKVQPAREKHEKHRPDYGHIHHTQEPAGRAVASTAPGSAAPATPLTTPGGATPAMDQGDTDPTSVDGVPVDVDPPRKKNSNKKTPDRDYDDKDIGAAKRIAAAYRGGRDRDHVRDMYRSSHAPQEKLIRPEDLGLATYVEECLYTQDISESLRYSVRDNTARSALMQLGSKDTELRFGFEETAYNVLVDLRNEKSLLPKGVQKQMAMVQHFVDPSPDGTGQASSSGSAAYDSSRRKQEQYLVGQFDCLAVPVRADYNVAFEPIPPGRHPVPAAPKLAAAAALETTPPEVGIEDNERLRHTANQAPTPAPTPAPILVPEDCDGSDGLAGWFWVVHAAAPNIGERANADDFHEYSREEEAPKSSYSYAYGYQPSQAGVSGARYDSRGLVQPCWKGRFGRRRLDEDLYIKDMGRLWRNALLAFSRLEIDDAIMFPFGMGAFLRHLGQNDDRYNDEKTMRRLRRRVAERLMDAIVDVCIGSEVDGGSATGGKGSQKKKGSPGPKGRAPGVRRGPARVHLCLMVSNAEGVENHNCFVGAAADRAKACPQLGGVLKVLLNVDCLQLACSIACSQWEKGPPKVGILNGANRKLIGNHWFQNGARSAIDENMHRRSPSMARSALLLNMNTEPRARKPFQLARHVVRWGGKVIDAQNGKLLAGPSPEAPSASPASPEVGSKAARTAYESHDDSGSCCCCCRRSTQRAPATKSSHAPATAAGNAATAPAPATAAGGGVHKAAPKGKAKAKAGWS